MNDQNTKHDQSIDHITRIHSQGTAVSDPRSYISHSGVILAQVRETLIKAESQHLAKRSAEIIAFKDRLLKMDREHEKVVDDLTAMIEKLEAFRA